MPERIQNPHEEGHQADEENIREGDAGQEHGELVFCAGCAKAVSLDSHNPRGEQNAEDRHHNEQEGKKGEHCPCQFKGVLLRLPGQGLRENRNKGDGERAFGKKASQEVGDAEGHEKSIRRHL